LLASALPAIGQPHYVAPAGHDANPGTLEKPFRQPSPRVRSRRAKAGRGFPAAGTYYLSEHWSSNPRGDFGRAVRSGRLQAYENERPVISGGIRLEN